jgi:6-bladed beta-propeller protein
MAASIARPGQAQAKTDVSRTKRGDTTFVVTHGNGRWGAPHDAIEVLRVPGDTRETTFGAVYTIEATPDGGVIVVDTKGAEGLIVRQFDANGKFVRNLGRSGPGPGEYMRMNLTVSASPRGLVYIRDDDKSVSVFGQDGKLVHTFPLLFNNGSTTEISTVSDGSIYVRAPFARTAMLAPGMQRPMLHYDVDGKLLDSVSVTTHWLPEGAQGNQWWQVLPDGRLLFTRTDKVGFMVVGRANAQGALIGEVAADPIPYLREEREEIQAARDLPRVKCGRSDQPAMTVPEMKPASRGGTVDVDGRIWISKSTTARKVSPKITASCSSPQGQFKAEVTYAEPPVYSAFLADGSYLGEVRFPMQSRPTFVGNTAWAMVPDDDGVQTLVKYRLY